jgi:hypothetical protein
MNIFFDLLPMMLGAALAPIWIISVLLILRSPNGLVKAIAFVAGITLVRLLQGFLFAYVFRPADSGNTTGPSPAISMLLAVLGLLLLISAAKTVVKEHDPDAPAPKWMTLFDKAQPFTLLGLGLLFTLLAPKLWVFTLSAIGTIIDANLSVAEEVKAFLLYVLGAQFFIVLPLVIYAIAPRNSATLLQSASDWLTKYSKPISLVVYIVFGFFFLQKGLSGLKV